MPGFFISNTNYKIELKNYDQSRCIYNDMYYNNWMIQRNTLDKFMDDKVFFQNEDYIIVLDGVILNKLQLMEEYQKKEWVDTIIYMIDESETFFEKFRGAFAGVVYDKKKDIWFGFTDHTSNRLLLVYSDGKHIAFGSELIYFSEWMKDNGIDRKLCSDWKNDFISFGYMLDAHTIIDGVKRVFPGSYIQCGNYNNWEIHEEQYYMITAECRNSNLSVDDAIERIDETFQSAVKRILDKNSEYGYKTVIDISGGLDSRMNACVASKMEKRDKLLCINYAQDCSEDQKIAKELVKVLDLQNVFYLIDGGQCIRHIDDFVFMNQGMNYYWGITGGKDVLELLDRKTYGIELIGVLGDVYEGVMIEEVGLNEPDWEYERFRTSRRFPVYNKNGYRRNYENNEILWFYVRGMLAGMNTAFIRQNYMEALTPYGDVEFMNLHFSLSYHMRERQHIYRKWMMKKYPEVAKIRYSGTGIPVTDNDLKEFVFRFPRRAWRKVRRTMFGRKKEWSMNPIDFWYKENSKLRRTFESYYDENIKYLKDYKDILEVVNEWYYKGDAMEKSLAVTVISAIKQYIIN